MVCWCTQVPWCILKDAYQRTSFLASGRFCRGHLIPSLNIDATCPVGQKWPNPGAHVEWEYKSSISWFYLCSGDCKRHAFSPFCACVRICFQRLAAWVSPMFSAARDIIWAARGNSTIIGRNAPARATAKQSTIKWFHLVLPEYYLTAMEMENLHGLHKCTQICQICWLVAWKHSLSLVFWLC